MLRLPKQLFAHIIFFLSSLLMAVPTIGKQKGKATYYSRKAHGRMTSSGVRLHNDSLVCAHRTHPFGTRLLVKNPSNGKEVIVKVIDRGPFGKGMVIDLSYEAARRLGILTQGVAMVEVSVYNDSPIPFKPKDYELPEIELEVDEASTEHDITPEWQHKEKGSSSQKEKVSNSQKEKASSSQKESHKEVSTQRETHKESLHNKK